MSGIIDLLKARQARSAAMLNPGKSSGSGSSLLLNSASLQPQKNFRRTRASFSVKRSSPTLLNMNSMASFSKSAETKYSGGQSLLHLQPTSSSAGTQTVQRQAASMPLPSSGGAAVPQAVSEAPVSLPSSTISTPSYPPKSERRPVVFDRSDGPSDFEKRLMANKKQKQAQEAKKRGPDRRQVRTERIEITPSSSGSNEIHREFFEDQVKTAPNSPEQTVKSAVPEPVRREMKPAGSRSAVVQRETSASNLQKTTDDRNPAPANESDPMEISPVQKAETGQTIQREELKDVVPARNADKPAETPAVQKANPARTVQREGLKTAEPVRNEPQSAEMPAVQKAESLSTIQREGMKTDEPARNEAKPAEIPAVQETKISPTVRRELQTDTKSAEVPAAQKAEPAPAIQREPLQKEDEPGRNEAKGADVSAVQKTKPAQTVQREGLKAAVPARNADKPAETPAVQKAEPVPTVQREEQENAEPVRNESHPAEMSAVQKAEPVPTVRREGLKTAEPVRNEPQQAESPAVRKAEPVPTVQREELKTAAPVRNEPQQAESPAVRKAEPVPTVQREEMKAAESVRNETLPSQSAEKSAAQKAESSPTVQREALKTAEPVRSESQPVEMPAVSKAEPAAVIRREPMQEAAAEAAPGPETTEIPRASEKKAVPSDTVNREILPAEPADKKTTAQEKTVPAKAKPAKTAKSAGHSAPAKAVPASHAETAEQMPVPGETGPAAVTVQREMTAGAGEDLSSLLKGLPTHYEMPKEQIEAIRSGKPYSPAASRGDTVQREPADILPDSAGESSDGSKKNLPERKAGEAVIQNIVRREPNLPLPKSRKESSSEKSLTKSSPSSGSKAAPSAPMPFSSFPSGMPGMGQSAQGGFGKMGADSGGTLPGAQPFGVVQREMADDEPPEPRTESDSGTPAEAPSGEDIEQKLDEILPEVTARQLDTLADKLVPRIKRMMRAEMERSIFW